MQCYYIVVDTNVLVRELDLVNELKDTPLDGKYIISMLLSFLKLKRKVLIYQVYISIVGCGPPHIFIPWVVIEELDKLKSQKIPKVLLYTVNLCIQLL